MGGEKILVVSAMPAVRPGLPAGPPSFGSHRARQLTSSLDRNPIIVGIVERLLRQSRIAVPDLGRGAVGAARGREREPDRREEKWGRGVGERWEAARRDAADRDEAEGFCRRSARRFDGAVDATKNGAGRASPRTEGVLQGITAAKMIEM